MNTTVQVEKLSLGSKPYWKLVNLPHVILQANNKEELEQKISKILPSYFVEFPSEINRVLDVSVTYSLSKS